MTSAELDQLTPDAAAAKLSEQFVKVAADPPGPSWLDKLFDPSKTRVPTEAARAHFTSLNQADVIPDRYRYQDPAWGAARGGLIGALLGGGAGLTQSILAPKKKRNTLSDVLTGSLLGGTGGAGLGLAMSGLSHLGASKIAPEGQGASPLLSSLASLVSPAVKFVDPGTWTGRGLGVGGAGLGILANRNWNKQEANKRIVDYVRDRIRETPTTDPTAPVLHDVAAAAAQDKPGWLEKLVRWVGLSPGPKPFASPGSAAGAESLELAGHAEAVARQQRAYEKLLAKNPAAPPPPPLSPPSSPAKPVAMTPEIRHNLEQRIRSNASSTSSNPNQPSAARKGVRIGRGLVMPIAGFTGGGYLGNWLEQLVGPRRYNDYK